MVVSELPDYTVNPPNVQPDSGCWDYRTVTKARFSAMKLGAGARLRRNVNLVDKRRIEADWWVARVWEWNGRRFVDITKNSAKGLP